MFLNDIQEKNQYPIIFIGAGITKRYFKDAPNWEELLKQIWDNINDPNDFYRELNKIRSQPNIAQETVLTTLATQLEHNYQTAFSNKKITIEGLTDEQVYHDSLSPMKKEISNIFKSLKIDEDMKGELDLFTKLLEKARMIITTNYDTLIEDRLNGQIKVNVGNKGLFESSNTYGELYKIHGSIKSPNSIIITKEDYEHEATKSTLVNAKILSTLTESPILFIGYSLTDRSIQSLLSDLSDNMPFDLEEAAGRIGIINYNPDFSSSEPYHEFLKSYNFGDSKIINLTEVQANDYSDIYKQIIKIDQGISPHEILQYTQAVKKIILTEGERGKLKPVLTSLVDLNKLDSELANRKIIMSIGDARYMFKMPTYLDYIQSYFELGEEIDTRVAIDFICSRNTKEWLPVNKYVRKANRLNKQEKSSVPMKKAVPKIKARNKEYPSLDNVLDHTADVNSQKTKELDELTSKFHNPIDLFASINLDQIADIKKGVNYIIKNVKCFDNHQLHDLLKYLFDVITDDHTLNCTEFRKLYVAISFKFDGDLQNLQ